MIFFFFCNKRTVLIKSANNFFITMDKLRYEVPMKHVYKSISEISAFIHWPCWFDMLIALALFYGATFQKFCNWHCCFMLKMCMCSPHPIQLMVSWCGLHISLSFWCVWHSLFLRHWFDIRLSILELLYFSTVLTSLIIYYNMLI